MTGDRIPLPDGNDLVLDNLIDQEYDHSDGVFHKLSGEEQEKLERAIVTSFESTIIAIHWQDIMEWKKEYSFEEQQREEALLKRELGSQRPVRGKSLNYIGNSYSDQEDEFIDLIYEISQRLADKLLQPNTEDQVTLYRGVGYEAPYIVAAGLQNPQRDSVKIPVASVAGNYSPSQKQAAYYSPLLIAREVDSNRAYVAPDYFLTCHSQDGHDLTRDGEYRIDGEVTSTVPADNITYICSNGGYQTTSFESFFDPLPRPDDPRHEDLQYFVEDLSKRIDELKKDKPAPTDDLGLLTLTNDEARQRLKDWCKESIEKQGDERFDYWQHGSTITDTALQNWLE